MAGTFDPYDKKSWYFGPLNRRGAEDLLNPEEIGVFLVRNSSTSQGDLVLCVKEEERVSHYIIHKIQQTDQTIFRPGNGAQEYRFRIGDQIFPDIPALLHYYKNTLLDTTALRRPIEQPERVKANYDFNGRDEDDLPFRKGDILTVLSKDEEQWWTARNDQTGQMGSIPVPYVVIFRPEDESLSDDAQHPQPMISDTFEEVTESSVPEHTNISAPGGPMTDDSSVSEVLNRNSSPPLIPSPRREMLNAKNATQRNTLPVTHSPAHLPQNSRSLSQPAESSSYRAPHIEQRLPAKARVIQNKYPNAYDKTALRLQVGDIVTVTKANINGQWEGELNGKTGHFPFTHVSLLDPDEEMSAPL